MAQVPATLGTIHDLLDIGPRVSQQDADAQLAAIHQGAHPLCQQAGDIHIENLTTHNSQSFKAAMIEAFLRNETGDPRTFYKVRAPAFRDDGFAFGPPQWTLSFPTRMDVLLRILTANGASASLIDQARDLLALNGEDLQNRWNTTPGFQATITQVVRSVNTILFQEGQRGIVDGNRVWANYVGYVDSRGAYQPGLLDETVGDIRGFVAGLRRHAGTAVVADYIDSHPELAVDIADRMHQRGATGGISGLMQAIEAAIARHSTFDIADYYAWALGQPGRCDDALRRLNNIAAVATDCGWLRRTTSGPDNETARINQSVKHAVQTCARGHPLSNEEIQAAYDQVRQSEAMSAPAVSSQTFQVGDTTVRVYYGPSNYSNSNNCQFIGVSAVGPHAGGGYQAAFDGGYANYSYLVAYGYGGNVYTAGYSACSEAIKEGQHLLGLFEQGIAAAQNMVSPNDLVGSQPVWPGTQDPLPASVLEAAQDSRWPTIAPAVAAQAAMQDPPTLVVDLDGTDGQIIPSRGPFDTGWLAPGDGLLVSDGSTIRSLTADGPGETVVAFNGDATLDGRPGDDILWAGAGNDTLIGGPGDIMHGGSGNDVFVSGPNDVMYGGGGTNVFQVSRGVGQVTVYANGSGNDTLAMGANIDPEDVRVVQDGPDLLLKIAGADDQAGTADQVRIVNQLADGDTFGPYPLNQATFADGTVWDAATLQTKSLVATEQGQVIIGFAGTETLVGRKGKDTLWAGSGTDTLLGGPNDVLYGGPGNDVFVSGRNNIIFAGTGTNTVKFGRQDGQDILNAGAGGATTVAMGTGIKPLDLVFALQPHAAQGEDLQVSVHSSADDFGRGDDRGEHDDDGSKHRSVAGITIPNWDATARTPGAQPPVATFATKHAELAGTDVGPLIQAMATFTADTGLSWDQAIERRRDDVQAILAQYWHPQHPATGHERGDDHGLGWAGKGS